MLDRTARIPIKNSSPDGVSPLPQPMFLANFPGEE